MMVASLICASSVSLFAQEKLSRIIPDTSAQEMLTEPSFEGDGRGAPIVPYLNRGPGISVPRMAHQKQILFEYHSSGMAGNPEASEDLFVLVAIDGRAQVVRYRIYNPRVIAVYGSRLPESERVRLVALAEASIPKASEINRPYIGSCDTDGFEVSLLNGDHFPVLSTRPNTICLVPMPKEIRDFVEEIKNLWKRLDESPLAYGYARTFPANLNNSKVSRSELGHIVSLRTLPAKLKVKVRAMTRATREFSGICQTEYKQLVKLASGSTRFYLAAGRGNHFLIELLLSGSARSDIERKTDRVNSAIDLIDREPISRRAMRVIQ